MRDDFGFAGDGSVTVDTHILRLRMAVKLSQDPATKRRKTCEIQ